MTTEPRVVTDARESTEHSTSNELAKRLVLRDPYQDYWSNVVLWISLAEATLPICLTLLGIVVSLFTGELFDQGFVYLSAMALASLCLGFTLLFVLTLMVAGILSALVQLVCKSLQIETANALVGAFTGGCVGLLIALPFPKSTLQSLLLLSLATTLGHVGGAYGAWKTYYRTASSTEGPSVIRFGVRQLLVLTFWLAVAMTGLKLTGMTSNGYLSFFGLWVMLQIAGLTALHLYERVQHRKLTPAD